MHGPGCCCPQVSCDGTGSTRGWGMELMPWFIAAAKALSSHQHKGNACSFRFPWRVEDLAGHTLKFSAQVFKCTRAALPSGTIIPSHGAVQYLPFLSAPDDTTPVLHQRGCIWLEGKPHPFPLAVSGTVSPGFFSPPHPVSLSLNSHWLSPSLAWGPDVSQVLLSRPHTLLSSSRGSLPSDPPA